MSPAHWLRGAAGIAVCLSACTRPPAETAVSQEPPRPIAARPQVARETRVEEALSRAPHLSRAAAEMLADAAERRGGIWGDPVDASLVEANRGFARLAPNDLTELGALFGEAYGTLSPADRAVVEAYVERVRRGDATDADAPARTLLGQGVKALPEARRARMQALLESSIRTAYESERRTALAAQNTPAPAPPVTAPPAWARYDRDGTTYHRPANEPATSSRDDEEAQLRAKGQQYKQQLESLTSSVRWAERSVESARKSIDSARRTPLNKRPMGDPAVSAAEQQLRDAEESLRQAQNALDDLHTQIRRERIPYSYLQ